MNKKEELKKLEKLATLMDSQFGIPGVNARWGLDSILGLIPGLGDTVTFASTAYFVGMAHKLEAPWHIKARMIFNGFIDWIVGLIPLLGDIFDIGFKANLKNLEILKKHLESE